MPPLSITQTNATKKLLLAFHQSRASATAGDFVVPIVDAGAATFLGLQSKKPIELAVVVYLGKEVSVNDLFAKLIDAGEKIADVERSMEVLTAYLTYLKGYKVGNVVSIEAAVNDPGGFHFLKVANTPSAAARRS